MKKYNTGIVTLSGGQDSTTCLGVALDECKRVKAIAFNYGQRHKVELGCAAAIAHRHGVELVVVEVSALKQLCTSALTRTGETGAPHAYKPGLPATFVPARNAIFLTLAHAYAQEHEAQVIYTGVCETDYSGYPDCRNEFVTKLEHTLNCGYETNIKIETPLMWLDKAATFALAEKHSILNTVIAMSHTCYEGDHTTRNDWGFGCGKCGACDLRAKGWSKYVHQRNLETKSPA